METLPRVAMVLGTRPEAVKLAPLMAELERRKRLQPWVISTGQHREMLEQTLAAFGVVPDMDLEVMAPGQTLEDIAARTLERLGPVFRQRPPCAAIVQGDTTTAFAAAVAAFYHQIPVVHVEAGLRSGRRDSPFPEEVNRRLVDQMSDVLFAPTARARDLLIGEGFSPKDVYVTGNTVVDALLEARSFVRRRGLGIPGLEDEKLQGRRVVVVTAHRRESFGEGLRSVLRALRRLVDEEPDTLMVFPVHKNPAVDDTVRAMLDGHDRIVLLPPLGYLEFVALLEKAYVVVTDSGGVQEEAPTFGKPILVTREVTERPEGIDGGIARLVGTDETRIVEELRHLLHDRDAYRAMSGRGNPYGDGLASRRMADILEARWGTEPLGPR